MTPNQMEHEIQALKERLDREIATRTREVGELESKLAALAKRVHQIEADYYKDMEEEGVP